MRAWRERYSNVFFGYRGIAVADVDLTPGRQLEDNLTRALAVTLLQASAESRASFVSDVAGLTVRAPSDLQRAQIQLQAVDAAPASNAVLLGLSPDGRLTNEHFEESPAGNARTCARVAR